MCRIRAGAALLLAAALAACGPGAPTDRLPEAPDRADPAAVADRAADPGDTAAGAQPDPSGVDRSDAVARVVLGIDVLVRDSLSLLRGQRVGLITNHTGLAFLAADSPRSTIDILHEHADVELVALFSPEHGIRGDVDRRVASGVDDRTGLPIHSLYGDTRKPTPAMLEGLDVLVFDIQDIGTRYYSYVWTMSLAMEAAAEHGLRFVVLDRPNPIDGLTIQGNVKPSYMPVAFYEAAMRHGLTAGEIARYVRGEYGLDLDLHVIPMDGWRRWMWWEDTGVPWRPPSPNMPSVEAATHYPGTCLFEGTNLSVGRGTSRAFEQVGAPWLDADAVADALRARGLPGVAIEAVRFTPDQPTDGKFPGAALHGLRFRVTDRASYDPVALGVAALLEITRRHGDRFQWRDGWFDGLAGGPRLREQIQAGSTLEQIMAPWPRERAEFERKRRPYLIYP